jgi:hypothetical protein
MEEKSKNAPRPPSSPSALCSLPTAVTSPAPTHSAPSPRPSPASTRPKPQRPALLAHVARYRPSMPLETLAPARSRAYKTPHRHPEEAHTHRYRSPLFSLPLSLGVTRSLWACTAMFLETPAAVGASAGARWRSGAAAVNLLPRRQALLPLRRALAVEHSSLHAPVSSSPSRGRWCLWAVRSRSIGRVPIRWLKSPDA